MSVDPTVREPAEREIQELLQKDLFGLLVGTADLIHMDGIDRTVVFQAFVTLRRAFTATPNVPVELISNQWATVRQEVRLHVIRAIVRGLLYEDESITGEASLVFALVTNCAVTEMLTVIPHLFNLVNDPDYSLTAKIAGLKTIGEICDPSILGRFTANPDVEKCIYTIFEHIGTWCVSLSSLQGRIQLVLLKSLTSLIKISDTLFKQEGLQSVLLSRTVPLLRNPETSVECVEQVFTMLFEYTNHLYDWGDFFFDEIGEITTDIILRGDSARSYAAMEFWIRLSQKEHKLEKQCQFCERLKEQISKISRTRKYSIRPTQEFGDPPVYRQYSCRAADRITTFLLSLLTQLDPSDISEEDVSERAPHMAATVLLESFYKIVPKLVLEAVRSFWERILETADIRSLKWVLQHALILSLIPVLVEPKYSEVKEFLEMKLPTEDGISILMFVVSGISAGTPKIVDTSLYVLSRCIQVYGFLSEVNSAVVVIANMSNLILTAPPPILVTRIFQVLRQMVRKRPVRAEFIEYFFDSFLKFAEVAAMRNDAMATQLFNEAHALVGAVIEAAPDALVSRISAILDKTLTELEGMTCIEEYEFVIQQQKLGIVENCFRKPRHLFTNGFGLRAANCCFYLMRNRNAAVWEEAMLCLIFIIRSLDDASEIYEAERINRIVQQALMSSSPSIITNTVWALSDLYQGIVRNSRMLSPQAEDLVKRLPDTFALISECLGDDRFGRRFYPFLLLALANVINACRDYVCGSDRDRLFQIYDDMWRKLPKECKSEDDNEHANAVFRAVFTGFAALMKTLDREEVAKDRMLRKRFMAEPPKAFAELGKIQNGGRISEAALDAFLDFLVAYNEVFQRQGNIILNRSKNWALMAYAAAVENTTLHQKAERVIKIVRDA
jgi:hypothetical protein